MLYGRASLLFTFEVLRSRFTFCECSHPTETMGKGWRMGRSMVRPEGNSGGEGVKATSLSSIFLVCPFVAHHFRSFCLFVWTVSRRPNGWDTRDGVQNHNKYNRFYISFLFLVVFLFSVAFMEEVINWLFSYFAFFFFFERDVMQKYQCKDKNESAGGQVRKRCVLVRKKRQRKSVDWRQCYMICV